MLTLFQTTVQQTSNIDRLQWKKQSLCVFAAKTGNTKICKISDKLVKPILMREHLKKSEFWCEGFVFIFLLIVVQRSQESLYRVWEIC